MLSLIQLKKEYQKYKWFFTSENKLVLAGKSSSQNDELLTKIKNLKKDFIILHTSSPGSPFSVILDDNPSKKDINETAIFTACFSKSWKNKNKKEEIHIFNSKNIFKDKKMKEGTWAVRGKIKKLKVDLVLYLGFQKKKLRALPFSNQKNLIRIFPGKTDKTFLIENIKKLLNKQLNTQDILSALPAGGISIKNG